MAKEFPQNLMFYKPKNDGTGSASQWSLSSEKNSVFLEMAHQEGKDDKGNARFGWNNKIRFKLGEPDIGELLSVLMGLQEGVGPLDTSKGKHKGLFHSNDKGNSILYFGKDKYGKYRIYLSVKREDDKTVVQHSINKGEACILGILLRQAIEILYRWH